MVSTFFIKFWGKYIQFILKMRLINIVYDVVIIVNDLA